MVQDATDGTTLQLVFGFESEFAGESPANATSSGPLRVTNALRYVGRCGDLGPQDEHGVDLHIVADKA